MTFWDCMVYIVISLTMVNLFEIYLDYKKGK